MEAAITGTEGDTATAVLTSAALSTAPSSTCTAQCRRGWHCGAEYQHTSIIPTPGVSAHSVELLGVSQYPHRCVAWVSARPQEDTKPPNPKLYPETRERPTRLPTGSSVVEWLNDAKASSGHRPMESARPPTSGASDTPADTKPPNPKRRSRMAQIRKEKVRVSGQWSPPARQRAARAKSPPRHSRSRAP